MGVGDPSSRVELQQLPNSPKRLALKAAMWSLRDCDVLLAVGTRLNPFCTNPQYGMKYFPDNAKIVQVEIDPRRLGLTKRVDANPGVIKCLGNKEAGMTQIAAYKSEWT